MSLSLLLEKYDVSTEEGLQKALCEIEKEESEVDEALTTALSRACTLEGRLRTASQGYNKLNEVKTDAQIAADMVEKTATLARDVSAKVRQLDLARSRVAECQRRVHDLIDLQLCSAGVEAAIKAHDYETGAAHVSRFLSMDPGSLAAAKARGAGDPREPMMKAANTLREHIVKKFEEASRKEDEASIERLIKLFPLIGRAEEGIDLLAKYLAGQLEGKIRVCGAVSGAGAAGAAAVFADALTRVLEAAAAALQRARSLAAPHARAHAETHARAHAAPVLPRALRIIQPQVCVGVRRIFRGLVSARRLGEPRVEPRAEPVALDPVLAELALALSRIHLYFNYVRRKTEADAAVLDEARRAACIDEVEKIIAESDTTRTAQDLLDHYLTLERYFLEESVNKALKLSTPQPGDTTSSLVDDVFFIARKVIGRSISTGSVDGACAALNDVGGALERCAAALRGRLRVPPPEPLPLPPPPGDAGTGAGDALPSEAAARALYLAQLAEAEAGGEWAARLAEEALAGGAALCRGARARQQLRACAAGLGGAAAGFAGAAEAARGALLAALQPRLHAWAERVARAPPPPAALPAALDALAEGARGQLSARTLEWLVTAAAGEVAAHAERRMLATVYTREAALETEACCRRLAAWCGASAGGARERAARLCQCAALLALESAAHAADALRPTPRISLATARDLLARRTDFKIEDIKRLKF